MRRALIAAVAWLVAAPGLSACNSGAPEFSGIGRFRFGHTTLAEINDGICQPAELNDGRKGTWCFAQTPIRIGTGNAEVDLYFLGTEQTARLIEIQLKLRGCHEDQLEQWMRSAFGAPIENRATRGYWKNAHLWAAALMPSEPGRCLVHFLPLSENAEIDRIKQI